MSGQLGETPSEMAGNDLGGVFGRSRSSGLKRLGSPPPAVSTAGIAPPAPIDLAALEAMAPAARALDEARGNVDDLVAFTIPVERVAANPLNNPKRAQDLSELDTMLTLGQFAPCLVVTRAAFHRQYGLNDTDPTRRAYAHAIGDADYVIVDGTRRHAFATAKNLGTLKIAVDDSLIADRATFLAVTHAANFERTPPNLMDASWLINKMVEELGRGGGAIVAERMGGKTEAWVSTMRSLQRLIPEVADVVRDGKLPLRIATKIARKDPEDQLPELRIWQTKHARETIKTVKAAIAEEQTDGDGDDDEAPAKTLPLRRWTFTNQQPPEAVAEKILERFTGAELDALIDALRAGPQSGS